MDCSQDILENTISYLYKISEALPHNLSIPKSYYASKSRILELKGQTSLPNKLTSNKIRCPRCCLKFADYLPEVRLKARITEDRFTKKMLKKIGEDKPLTNYQEKFKKLLQKRSNKNILIKTCQFCKEETKTNIDFKEKRIKKKQVEYSPIVKSKKKKKKDKFAGLTPSTVISINESKLETVKKSLREILVDDSLKKKEQENKIKYNVIGTIEEKKKKKNKKKKTVEVPPIKSTKMKLLEKKEMKADKKKKNKMKDLLSGWDKQKASNILSGFLESL